MTDTWMLSKNIPAEKNDEIAIFATRKSATEHIAANIMNMDDASFLVIDIGTGIYDLTHVHCRQHDYEVHMYNSQSPESEGFDVIKYINMSGYAHSLPEYLFYGEEREELFSEEGRELLKYNEYRLLFCTYWYLLCTREEEMKLTDMAEMLKEMSNAIDVESVLSPFYEYEEKCNHYSPMTGMLKELSKLTLREIQATISSLYIRLQEFELKNNKELLQNGDLGLESLFDKKSITYLCLNKYTNSLVDQVLLYAALCTFEKSVPRYPLQNVYLILNITESDITIPWEMTRFALDNVIRVVSVKNDFECENNMKWFQKYDPRFCSGSWVALDVDSKNDAELLSHRGGFENIEIKWGPFKRELSARKIYPKEILNMDTAQCYVIKNHGNSYEGLAVIDDKFGKEEEYEG